MSIDAKLDDLIKALNRVAESNETLAKAYGAIGAAPDNGPKATKGAPAATPAKPAPAPAPTAAPVAEAAPAAASGFQLADVRAALSALPRDAVPAILAKFGAAKLSALAPEQYGAVIAAAQASSSEDPLL